MKEIGILDPKGQNNNPFTNEPYSDNYKQLANMWTKLPVYTDRKKIIKDIVDNQVILVVSGTGSGKSVLVPKYALHALNYDKLVVITNPKKPATIENARFASETMDVSLGSYVGYQYKGAPTDSKSDKTKLLFSTDGAVVSQLLNDPSGKEFGVIIVDEAHERAVQIDFLLFLLKRAIQINKELKVIIMSATINKDTFIKYFKKKSKFAEITISGAPNFPIKEHFLSKPTDDFIGAGISIVKKLTEKLPKGDIIFFVNSGNMGKQSCHIINDKIAKNVGLYCTVLSSGITIEEQDLVISEIKYKQLGEKYKIKLVMSTNIGESSITINNLYYVIDSGFQLEDSFDPDTNSRQLLKTRISKAQAKQRWGRAGRTQPGETHNLYTKNEFDAFDDYPKVSIEKSDITDFILRLYNMEDMNKNKIDKMLGEMITVPKPKYVDFSINLLEHLKIIQDDKITDLGKIVNSLNMDPKNGVSLIYSHFYQCRKLMCYILAIIEISNRQMSSFFISGSDMRTRLMKISSFYHKLGDLFTILKIFKQFSAQEDKQTWCYDNYINYKNINKIEESKNKIYHNLKKNIDNIKNLEIEIKDISESKKQNIIMSLMEGYKTNIAHRVEETNTFINTFAKIKTVASIDQDSSIKSKPNKILYLELANIMNRKKYNFCTIIN